MPGLRQLIPVVGMLLLWAGLEWASHASASAVAYVSFAYTGSEYAPVSYLQFPASPMTFPER